MNASVKRTTPSHKPLKNMGRPGAPPDGKTPTGRPDKQADLHSAKRSPLHRACLSLGSNIDPLENMHRAVALLRQKTHLLALSNCYETRAVGSSGPNFLNMAVCLETSLDAPVLKSQVLAGIERQLGRVRTSDKNAPRTIDLDIVLFDDVVLEDGLWRRVYLAAPFSELLPDLLHPVTGQSLRQVAEQLLAEDFAIPRPFLLTG